MGGWPGSKQDNERTPMTENYTQRKRKSACVDQTWMNESFPAETPKSFNKRFFIQEFVVLFDTGLSVFLDLNLPCRHDFSPVSTVRRKASL